MFRKTKELQSLVNASRKNLKDAERKVEDRNILIADLQKKNEELTNENLAVHEENKDLRFENLVLNINLYKFISIFSIARKSRYVKGEEK